MTVVVHVDARPEHTGGLCGSAAMRHTELQLVKTLWLDQLDSQRVSLDSKNHATSATSRPARAANQRSCCSAPRR